ncbi:TraQ conjugal transfer family protein, partial [Mesoflavibacter zeaxanthinifaciens]
MNKIKTITRFLLLSLLIVFACTKDADIQLSFPFTLEDQHNEIATINYREPTKITINPEQIVTDNIYQFSYSVIEGEGYLRYEGSNEPLLENTNHTCEALELNLEFIGTELGLAKLSFIVDDLEDRSENIILNYNVIHNPFTWEANSALENVTINQTVPLVNVLDNTGPDQSVTYDYKIYFPQGNGKLFETDGNGNSTDEIEHNVLTQIDEGVYQRNIKLFQTGVNKIVFEAIDSNGQIKKDSLIYNVDVIDFNYLGTPQDNTLFVGNSTNINFQINELLGGNDAYTSRYEFNSGNAILKRTNNGIEEILQPGISYDVNIGSYYWEFEATEVGTIDMTFYAENASGVEHSINLIIEVTNGAFNFNAIPTSNFGAVNDEIAINFDINESGPSGAPYTMFYETTGGAEFIYNSLSYTPGSSMNINYLNFTGNYLGNTQGSHEITFTITNAFGDTVSDTITLLFNQDNFNFTAAAEQQIVIVNSYTDFNFNITDSDNGSTYQMFYSVSGTGDADLTYAGNTYDAGIWYDVPVGGYSWEFNPIAVGDLTYTFTVENNSGVQESQVIDVTIEEIPNCQFNFTAIASENSAIVGEDVAINFNVNSTVAGSNYTMIYTTSESGSLDYNGTTYTPGEVINLGSNPSSFVATYAGSTQGAHDLDFTITCDGGSQETQSASIAYSNIDFNLTSAGDTSLYVNTIEDFTLFLSQTATDPSITYDVVFSLGTGTAGNGNITDNGGAALTLGTSYPLAIGSTGFNFEGTAVGLVNVVATVTDSNGVVHSTTIAMDVQDISYTFTAAAQNNTIGAGGSTAINMSIIEDLFSGADYQLKYVMVSGTGSVTNNGTPLNTNTFYNVTTGNFAWTFEAGSAGTTELLFTAVNTTTGEEQTQTVTITVDNAPACQFNFTAIASENSAIVGEDVAINFNVNSTVPGTNYTMIYTTSESGSLDYNGTTY